MRKNMQERVFERRSMDERNLNALQKFHVCMFLANGRIAREAILLHII